MRPAPNRYTDQWFKCFHVGIDENRTTRETEFVCSVAPLPQFRAVADVCCGMGRHARALAARGYSVTGIDRDDVVIEKGRQLAGGPRYIQADLREYQPATGAYDVAIVMGQSFGHFDATTNRAVLGRMTTALRQDGRVVLDLWNSDFFASHQGERDFELPNGVVRETKCVQDGRLFVHLAYPTGDHEEFEWQLFTRSEMLALADSVGLTLILSCTDFDSSLETSSSKPRIQFVLERSANAKKA